jgi:hypothetical protein
LAGPSATGNLRSRGLPGERSATGGVSVRGWALSSTIRNRVPGSEMRGCGSQPVRSSPSKLVAIAVDLIRSRKGYDIARVAPESSRAGALREAYLRELVDQLEIRPH